MRKIAAILLSLTLSLSLLSPAWAADSGAPVLKIEDGSGRLVLDGLGDQLVYSIQLELTTSGTSGVSFDPAGSNSERYFGIGKPNGNEMAIYIDSFQSLNDDGAVSLGTLNLGGNTVTGDAALTLLGSNLEPSLMQCRIQVETVPSGTLTPSTPSDPPSDPSTPSTPSTPTTPTSPSDPSAPDFSDLYDPSPSPSSAGTGTSSGISTSEKTITVTPSASIQGGVATAAVNTTMGNEIVRQAVSNNSESVVIAPSITQGVTKAEISIPASTVGQIGRQTNASLTMSTSVADVIIPNGGLNSLSSAGGTITVTTEKVENTVDLSVTAAGQAVGSIPGGVILTVPAANATPGTVAILVHENGTQEIVRKSVAVDGRVTIPLDGSAKLRIVDNSKYFADVPATSWAAGAVAFASSHELFNGTAPAQFSPELPMSRGMLAVVLHNLEGNPAQALASAFTDVSRSAWYAGGVAWAASNGIVGGYGNGLFGPNDNITREQLAVMLWRYIGSPAAANKELRFADANKASGWALEALCWATENGIINGKGGGILDPAGQATRAETAQMLKNLMENLP